MKDTIYLHIWNNDNNKSMLFEQTFCNSIQDAIESYWMEEGFYNYVHTLVLYPFCQKFETIDIRDYIDEHQMEVYKECELEKQHIAAERYNYYQTRL